ncbi:MAG TPA: YciI family protein [Puia sp.]
MEKFMLIVREDLEKIGRLTPEERFSTFPTMLDWVRSIAESGNYIGGEPLAITGRYVSKNEVLSDGPFIESKEGVSGYDIIMAENINQAVAIAQTCPMVMQGLAVREVRPIQAFVSKTP